MRRPKLADLLVFGLAALYLTTFLNLLAFGDQKTQSAYEVFGQMAMWGWIMIPVYALYTNYKPGAHLPVDFDNNITADGLIKAGLGYVLLMLVALFSASWFQGKLNIVTLASLQFAVLFYIPRADASGVVLLGSKNVTEFLRQMFVVAHGEEILRAVGSLLGAALLQANFRMQEVVFQIEGKISVTKGMVVSLIFANGVWSAFHAMRATVETSAIVSIFLCGLVLTWVLLSTGSVLMVILAHAAYNMTVVLMAGNVLPSAAYMLVQVNQQIGAFLAGFFIR